MGGSILVAHDNLLGYTLLSINHWLINHGLTLILMTWCHAAMSLSCHPLDLKDLLPSAWPILRCRNFKIWRRYSDFSGYLGKPLVSLGIPWYPLVRSPGSPPDAHRAGESRQIKQRGVYAITAMFSIFAHLGRGQVVMMVMWAVATIYR